MQFSLALLATVVTGALAQTNIDLFSDGGCGNYVSTVESSDTSGACIEISGFPSVRTTQVATGCSVTVYTDSVCSTNAFIAGLGACVVSSGWYSFSIDC